MHPDDINPHEMESHGYQAHAAESMVRSHQSQYTRSDATASQAISVGSHQSGVSRRSIGGGRGSVYGSGAVSNRDTRKIQMGSQSEEDRELDMSLPIGAS